MTERNTNKRVRFSEEDVELALNPESSRPSSSRETLLPKPETGVVQLESTQGEEGTVKSTNPEFAAAFRARHRKQIDNLKAGEAVDISLLDEVALAEEEDEDDDDYEMRFTEEGIPIEPFNLRSERAQGFFDADGSYVAYREDDTTDAWLDALPEGPILSGSSRKPAAKPAHGSDEQKPEMTDNDKDIYRRRIIQTLQPGETVLDALRRLGALEEGPPTTQSSEQGSSKANRLAAMRSKLAGSVPERNRAAFNKTTEDASQLLNAGDTGIYTVTREQLVSKLLEAPQSSRSLRGADSPPRHGVSAEAAALSARLAGPRPTDMDVDEEAERREGASGTVADPGGDIFADTPWEPTATQQG